MRVSFDLQSENGIRKYAEFIERAADLVISYGGSLSGEHGDGQSRGALLPKMFGPELMRAFTEFKCIWDPGNKMNPHKVVNPYLPTENLRLGVDYKPLLRRPILHLPETTALCRKPPCDVSGWEPVVSRTVALCAQAIWLPSKRNTAPGAALICSLKCCKEK